MDLEDLEKSFIRLDELESKLDPKKLEFGNSEHIEYVKLFKSLSSIELNTIRRYRNYLLEKIKDTESNISMKVKEDLNGRLNLLQKEVQDYLSREYNIISKILEPNDFLEECNDITREVEYLFAKYKK